jgi:hypothetical protein
MRAVIFRRARGNGDDHFVDIPVYQTPDIVRHEALVLHGPNQLDRIRTLDISEERISLRIGDLLRSPLICTFTPSTGKP